MEADKVKESIKKAARELLGVMVTKKPASMKLPVGQKSARLPFTNILIAKNWCYMPS